MLVNAASRWAEDDSLVGRLLGGDFNHPGRQAANRDSLGTYRIWELPGPGISTFRYSDNALDKWLSLPRESIPASFLECENDEDRMGSEGITGELDEGNDGDPAVTAGAEVFGDHRPAYLQLSYEDEMGRPAVRRPNIRRLADGQWEEYDTTLEERLAACAFRIANAARDHNATRLYKLLPNEIAGTLGDLLVRKNLAGDLPTLKTNFANVTRATH